MACCELMAHCAMYVTIWMHSSKRCVVPPLVVGRVAIVVGVEVEEVELGEMVREWWLLSSRSRNRSGWKLLERVSRGAAECGETHECDNARTHTSNKSPVAWLEVKWSRVSMPCGKAKNSHRPCESRRRAPIARTACLVVEGSRRRLVVGD